METDFLSKPFTLSKTSNKGHRRTQSNINYDFRQFNSIDQKENDQNFKNMIEVNQIFDKTQTKQVLEEETRKQTTSDEKKVVIENIDPPFQELNKYENADKNFFAFGKKNRNLTTIFGEKADILKELDFNDLSNRKHSRTSIHESNPAKRYEREFLKEDKFFVIPEQNDLLQSTEFPNNKIISRRDEKKQDIEKIDSKNFLKSSYTDEKKDEKKPNSDSNAQHFQSLMHLKTNIIKVMSKTNNRYSSKEDIKTTRPATSKILKEYNTLKSKKNYLTVNFLKEKPKFSQTPTLNFMVNKAKISDTTQIDLKNSFKHKKNSVSVVNNKKDISFSSLKKSERMEKDFLKLETQVNFLKKKVEVLENQNKNFKHQMNKINEEKNLYMKVFKIILNFY